MYESHRPRIYFDNLSQVNVLKFLFYSHISRTPVNCLCQVPTKESQSQTNVKTKRLIVENRLN